MYVCSNFVLSHFIRVTEDHTLQLKVAAILSWNIHCSSSMLAEQSPSDVCIVSGWCGVVGVVGVMWWVWCGVVGVMWWGVVWCGGCGVLWGAVWDDVLWWVCCAVMQCDALPHPQWEGAQLPQTPFPVLVFLVRKPREKNLRHLQVYLQLWVMNIIINHLAPPPLEASGQ